MPNLLLLVVVCLRLAASNLCIGNSACSGNAISCWCESTDVLYWDVFRPSDMERLFTTECSSGSCMVITKDYNVTLNSTNPLTSQLTVTLQQQEPELLVQCDSITTLSTTLHTITAPRRPSSLDVTVSPTPNTGNVTVTVQWDPPMEDSSVATVITAYLINITEPVTGLTQQLSSTNMSVTTQLNTAGEYLVQVVAVNCAGASQESAILFNVTEQCLVQEDSCQKLSSTKPTFITTAIMRTTAGSTTPTPSISMGGCVENWHIGIAVAIIVITQIISTVICVTTAVILKAKRAKDVPADVMEISPRHSEQVRGEEHAYQGDPMYEDILLQAKSKEASIKLEENVAYSVATKK